MKILYKIAVTTVLFLGVPLLCYCQYFQRLNDINSSADWGINIFLQPDGNYFIRGTSIATHDNNRWFLVNMQMTPNGDTILGQKLLRYEDINLYAGNIGEMKNLVGGGYISPITIQPHNPKSWAGLAKYNSFGDTIFLKTYTDTNLFYDRMFSCAVMPDGGYIAGGQHGLNNYAHPGAFIVRTDSMGDTLWTHTYPVDTSQFVFAQINNLIPISDGRIIAGAMSTKIKYSPSTHIPYYYNAPWYMLLDSMGNIIRDTLYTNNFMCCGFIYKDKYGGYTTIGKFDSLNTLYPDDIENFPSFVAHLDTNFRITWSTTFPYSLNDGHREEWLVRQLNDSDYIVVGDKWTNDNPGNFGWAVKLNRYGNVVWNKYYQSDNNNEAHIRDVVEKQDGSLVFIGTSFNDTLPSSHNIDDVWLVGVDSNGCENAFCAPVKVEDPAGPPRGEEMLSVFPNPNSGSFTINFSSPGNEPARLTITDITGKKIKELSATANQQIEITLPVPSGLYFISAATATSRLVQKLVVE